MRGTSVLIAGAGLAGLTAARELTKKGAAVTVIDARDRVGGRVLTMREPFLHGQHAEAGADLIDESQTEICKLIADVGLRTASDPAGRLHVGPAGPARGAAWRASAAGRISQSGCSPKSARSASASSDGMAASRTRSRESRSRSGSIASARRKALKDVAVGLRGFFLADPDELSLLALTDQFAEDGTPGSEKMFRIIGGNDRLPAALARALGSRMRLRTILRRVVQTRDGVTAALESNGRLSRGALRLSRVRDAGDDGARRGVRARHAGAAAAGDGERQVRRCDENRAAVRSRDRGGSAASLARSAPRCRSAPCGTETRNSSGSHRWQADLLARGGGASAATREMLAAEGPSRIVRELSWLNLKNTELLAWTSLSWEHEPWSRGGYAFFDTQFPPSLRYWLARPFGRIFFAGEHTSLRWQGYMNGAVETGLRAAEEVAARTAETRGRKELLERHLSSLRLCGDAWNRTAWPTSV